MDLIKVVAGDNLGHESICGGRGTVLYPPPPLTSGHHWSPLVTTGWPVVPVISVVWPVVLVVWPVVPVVEPVVWPVVPVVEPVVWPVVPVVEPVVWPVVPVVPVVNQWFGQWFQWSTSGLTSGSIIKLVYLYYGTMAYNGSLYSTIGFFFFLKPKFINIR
jgi:hypothetical protein